MKSSMLGTAVFLAMALISKADPIVVCTNLVGSYAEPQAPEKQEDGPCGAGAEQLGRQMRSGQRRAW